MGSKSVVVVVITTGEPVFIDARGGKSLTQRGLRALLRGMTRPEKARARTPPPAQEAHTDTPRTIPLCREGNVAALLTAYLSDRTVENISPGQLGNIRKCMTNARLTQGWEALADITRASAKAHLLDLKARGCGPKGRNEFRSILAGFLRWARLEGHATTEDIALGLPRARVPKRQARIVPSEAQVRAIVEGTAAEWRSGNRWLLWLTAASTGARTGQLKATRWEWVHLEDMGEGLAWIDYPANVVKGRRDQRVWLTREVAEWLQRGRQRTGLVFPCSTHTREWGRDLRRAGVARKDTSGRTLTPHSLRHFANMRLATLRTPDELRRRALDHDSLAMSERTYYHTQAAMLGKFFWGLQPLMPAGFRGGQRRKTAQKAKESVDRAPRGADDNDAEPEIGDDNGNEPPTPQPEPPEPARAPDSAPSVVHRPGGSGTGVGAHIGAGAGVGAEDTAQQVRILLGPFGAESGPLSALLQTLHLLADRLTQPPKGVGDGHS